INQFYNTNKSLKNLKFKTLNENQFDINNLKGKYVLVDFWATWCPPCVEEIPNLASLYQKYKSSGFEIIGISLDTNQDVLKKFISKNNIKWENYFDGKAWENPIARSNMISSVPSTFLLDKNGNVLYSNLRGFLLAEILEELLF
nr:TlpA family protein disulfide reductase [Candidatus Dependentiae bacterium]